MKTWLEDTSIVARTAEIEWKAARIRVCMEEQGWDAVLINKYENFAWITAGGSNLVTRYAEGGICSIVITKTARYFLCNNIETQRMIDEEQLIALGFEPLTYFWFEDGLVPLLRHVIGNGVYATDCGVAGGKDANAVVQQLERVLHENEIGRYLELGRIFSRVIESFMPTVRPGDVEEAIAGRLGAAMWANGLDPVLYLVASDERIAKYRHAIPTKKRVDKVLLVSCNARYKGLITKITRMMYFGQAPDALLEQYRKNIEIENRMIAMTKPGVDDLDIFNSTKRFYAEAGYPDMWQLHHQGGPQSYNNGFYLMSGLAHETIQMHQCYGYNPSITGTKTEDCFVVTEEGPAFITEPVYYPALVSEVDGIRLSRPDMLQV